MLEKLEKDMKISMEILDSMPSNNEKNTLKFNDELSKEVKKYENIQDEIYLELKDRCLMYEKLKFNDFSEKKRSIDVFSKALLYTTNLNTSYEKLGIDKVVYNLANYKSENDDLDYLNKNILKVIYVFKLVGINLSINDFKYTSPVFRYMKELFTYKDDLSNKKLKEAFYNIYWECPKLTLHIELCIRHLYLKNIKKFESYIKNFNKKLLDKFTNKEKSLIDDYAHERDEYDTFILNDKNNILYNFYNDVYDASSFEESKITEIINKYFDDKSNIELNISKILNSLNEYKNYVKYSKLIEKAKGLYKEEIEKDFLQKKLKEINKLESKLFNLNKRIARRYTVTKVDKNEPLLDEIISNIKNIYDEIDNSIMKVKIKIHLKENSTIFLVLLLVSYNYVLSTMYFKEVYEDVKLKDIDDKISELLSFTLNPNNTVITNSTFLSENNIAEIISENYKLLGINIEQSSLENDVDNLISDMDKIRVFYKLKKYGISPLELLNVKQSKVIIQNKQKKD